MIKSAFNFELLKKNWTAISKINGSYEFSNKIIIIIWNLPSVFVYFEADVFER